MNFIFDKQGAMDANGNQVPAYGINHEDCFIWDPYASTCGRFLASPADYGLTEEDAQRLVKINRGLGLEL